MRSGSAPARTTSCVRCCAVPPGVLAAFADKRDGLLRPEARALLAAAPTPTTGAALTKPRLRALLKRAGRQRGLDAEAARIQTALRTPQLRQLRRSKTPSAGRPSPCSDCSTRPAPTPRNSPPKRPRILTSTRTPRSSPACQD
jgi:hypothetical protein